MAKQRGNGEGSIFQRRDGRWVGEIQVGWLPDGKPDRRYVYRSNEQDARKALAQLTRANDAHTLPSKDASLQTVAEYLDSWLELSRSRVRASTHKRYSQLLRLHVIPSIGKVKLGNLKPAQLDTLYRQLALTETTRGQRANDANPVPLSSRTVHHIHVVLHTALAHAVRAGDLPTNVCDRVSAPKVKATKRTVPNVDDLKRLLADSASDPLLPLWVTAVATGARLGELLGLQWTDLDSDNMTLHIHQTLLGCDAGTPVWGEPKTEAGKRTISVPAEVISVLHNHRQSQRENGSKVYAAYNLIFAAGNGNPLMQRNVVRSFKAALRRAGLPETIRIHDLRHAHATALRATGADIKDVSERLGHRDTTITNDLYTHAIAGRDASVAARFGVAMGW